MKFDLSRLTVLGTISAREKAAAAELQEALSSELSAAKEIRRKIVAEQRRESDRTTNHGHIEDLRTKESEINQRVEDHEASLEVLNERANAAYRLRKSCEAWVARNVQVEDAE